MRSVCACCGVLQTASRAQVFQLQLLLRWNLDNMAGTTLALIAFGHDSCYPWRTTAQKTFDITTQNWRDMTRIEVAALMTNTTQIDRSDILNGLTPLQISNLSSKWFKCFLGPRCGWSIDAGTRCEACQVRTSFGETWLRNMVPLPPPPGQQWNPENWGTRVNN